MSDNRAEGMAAVAPPERREGGGRLQRWLAPLLVLGAILLVGELLILAGVRGSAGAPESGSVAWLDAPRNAVVALIATPTPTPLPTPTRTPEETAAQFAPQLQVALTGAAWDRALEIVAIMQAVDPSGEQVREWAFDTFMRHGQALVSAGQEAQAQGQFDEAVDLVPEDAEALLWQKTTQLYLAGREALTRSEWDSAIESFTGAYDQIPEYGDLLDRLVESYRRKGQAAIEAKDWPVAVEALVQAHDRAPKDPEVVALLTAAYHGHGRAALAEQAWDTAIDMMGRAQERLPKDAEVKDLLAAGYRGRGIARHEALQLKKAKADLEAALALRPKDKEARTHLDRVEYLLSKRIEIDISKQRMYVYKGNKLVFNFPVSTGLRGRDTATGHFQVLDKIPMAYSRVWRLKMPHWLGVYYVGGIENGIHALPIRPDGSVMWAGLLGQRASYGCIILSKQAAKQLYNWADVGTQVHIHP